MQLRHYRPSSTCCGGIGREKTATGKKKKKRDEKKDGQPSPPPQELPANNIQELEAGQLMNEMDAERGFVEAPPGNRVISELPGDHTRKESMEKGAKLP